MDNRFDVVVIGAGPVGSYVSGKLSSKGFRVLLLDRKKSPGRRACTGVIGSEAFEAFPLPGESVLGDVRFISVFSPSGIRLDHSTEKPMAYVVDRLSFDVGMLEWALRMGVRFMGGVEVIGLRKEMGGVEVICLQGGFFKSFQSRLVVVASGCGGRLISSLGVGRYPGIVMGIQRVDLMKDVDGVEVYFGRKIAPGGFAWLVPLGDGRVRVGLVSRAGGSFLLEGFTSFPSVSERLVENCSPAVSAPIPMGPLPVTYGNGFLVVGEAAGQVKATTYGGVFYGLICGDCAIDTVISAFDSGRFDGAFLSSYQSAWKDKIGSELEFGSKLRDVALRLSDRDIDRIFLAFSKNGLLSKFKSLIKFDWHAGMVKAVLGCVVS